MTAHTERRVDTTVSLAVALRLSHADTLKAIAQALPELPAETDKLTRAESMKVTSYSLSLAALPPCSRPACHL